MPQFKVTPWEVSGEVDYEKLVKEFGTEQITDSLLERIKKHTKELHFMLKRKVFFSHRDLTWLLDKYEKGEKFHLYTGRGPSGNTHIGHLVPWIFTKWLQDKFNAKLLFQMTDDEKFFFNQKLTLEEANRLAYENALDVIALGFDPKKTQIFTDLDYSKTVYKEACKVAKKLTFSTAKAVFGFTNESNVGQIFFTSMQSAPAFLESIKAGKNVPCLIPLAIDQDAHFRISRDILPKLGYYKPSIMHCRFLPGLGGPGKMSASDPNSTIYTTDPPESVRAKINKYAFSGGRATVEEHRKLGGNPDIDVSYQWLRMFFEPDDKKLEKIYHNYKSGALLTGELKEILIEKVEDFLRNHQKEREKARSKLDKFVVKD